MKNLASFLLSGFILLSLFFACTKIDTTSIGSNLIPGADKVESDTMLLPVITSNYTNLSDSTRVSAGDDHVFGYLDDPLFGTSEAQIFFQVAAPFYKYTFENNKDSLYLDSVVLTLGYASTYGDTLTPLKMNVYKMNELLQNSDTLYPFPIQTQPSYSTSDLLGSKSFAPNSLDKQINLQYKNDSVINQLRIRLNDDFGQSLLEQDSTVYANDSTFKDFLNGFALIPETGNGGNAFVYFNLQDDNTGLLLYYRYKKNGTTDTTVKKFAFNFSSLNVNHITRDHSSGEIANRLNTNTPDSYVYLQAVPGTHASVTIPDLDTITNKIIHRAELVATQVYEGPADLESYLAPGNIFLYGERQPDELQFLPYDSLFTITSTGSVDFGYSGGTVEYTTDAAGHKVAKYALNMTRYVQNILTKKTQNIPLQLRMPYYVNAYSPFNRLAAGRVRLGGGLNPDQRMYVRIIYSKL